MWIRALADFKIDGQILSLASIRLTKWTQHLLARIEIHLCRWKPNKTTSTNQETFRLFLIFPAEKPCVDLVNSFSLHVN